MRLLRKIRKTHLYGTAYRPSRRAALWLALVLAASMLFGCASLPNDKEDSAKSNSQTSHIADNIPDESDGDESSDEIRESGDENGSGDENASQSPAMPDSSVSDAPKYTEPLPDATGTAAGNGSDGRFDLKEFLYDDSVQLSPTDIPAYVGEPYVAVHDNVPYFSIDGLTTVPFERYEELDELGRCVGAYACLSRELMPTEKRGSIGSVKPTGWQTVRYDIVDGGYLYNRCHLIAYQLTAENANEKNLITGTRYMNVEGMLPFENMTADYIKENEDRHVLYRATPIFDGDNALADGVLLEAMSVEDRGESLMFCVFCYNVQPGIAIDYATGDSYKTSDLTFSTVDSTLLPDETNESESGTTNENDEYVLNIKSKKFHRPSCGGVKSMAQANRRDFIGTREELLADGYELCGTCKP